MNEKRPLIAVVNFDGKVLLGKKRSDSPKRLSGEWHVPGETAEEGESDEEALIRGMKEEVGIKIKVGRYLASHITSSGKNAKWYECFADTWDVIPGSDLEDAKFVSKKGVLKICGERANSFWPKEILEYFDQSDN